jgi:hypothetical protein
MNYIYSESAEAFTKEKQKAHAASSADFQPLVSLADVEIFPGDLVLIGAGCEKRGDYESFKDMASAVPANFEMLSAFLRRMHSVIDVDSVDVDSVDVDAVDVEAFKQEYPASFERSEAGPTAPEPMQIVGRHIDLQIDESTENEDTLSS